MRLLRIPRAEFRKSARHRSSAGFSLGESSKAYSRSEDAVIRVYDAAGATHPILRLNVQR